MRSANEKKSINVKRFFLSSEDPQEDVEVMVKCCSWSADGSEILVAAKNKILVSQAIFLHSDGTVATFWCGSVIGAGFPTAHDSLEPCALGDTEGLVRSSQRYCLFSQERQCETTA